MLKGRIAMLSTQSRNSNFKVITNNNKTKLALNLAREMAKTTNPVIIHGESGTGKNLFAKYIHQQSQFCSQPFTILPSNFAENSDLQIKTYLCESRMGTLLLDSVQELEIQAQMLLHKHLINSVEQHKIRIITTTSTDLDKLVAAKKFSAELLTILRGGYIELLPLNERGEDIGSLVAFYVEHFCQANALPSKTVSTELLHVLEAYNWPGNIRELVNTVVQLVITSQTKQTLFAKDLPAHIRIQTLKSAAAQKQGL